MGKSIKSREARRHKAELAVVAKLQAYSKRNARPDAPERFDDFAPELVARVHTLRGYALRSPLDWHCRIKSRSPERRLIDLVRFSFARFRVPAHLETVWIGEVVDDLVDRVAPLGFVQDASRRTDLCRWYLTAAQGGSLYKQHTSGFLSKLETHHLLTAPATIVSTQQALWYAVARGQTDRSEVAQQVARSRLNDYSIASSYWREVARFFARHPVPLHEMDDLIDYLRVAKTEAAGFSLKGRTLESLRRRKDEWHRALRKSNEIGGGSWPGRSIPDVEYEVGGERRTAIWRFRQIRTGNELFREGQRMHHCVATYKGLCVSGAISIWSLTSEFPLGHRNRGVTMEVRSNGAIVQCRGFANRLPYANEVTMAKRWAQEFGLTWQSVER